MDRVQQFIDHFVRSFQPEPEVSNTYGWLKQIQWHNDINYIKITFFPLTNSCWYSGNNVFGRFKFDGSPESIPEELMDAIFEVNSFTDSKHENPRMA
jgi:hypothetical protein